MASSGEFDVGPLSWVKGEIDQALERAMTALRAFAANTADIAPLKTSRTQLHQAHGALQIVGLDGVARFSEELEGLLGELEAGKAGGTAIGVIERAASAISTYLEQLLAGQPNQPLKLYSLYREVAAERGKPVPDPVDLFYPDLSLRLPTDSGVTASGVDRVAALKSGRSRFMRGLLRWLRKDREGVREMQEATAMIEAAETIPSARTFWWATSGLLEGIAQGGLADESLVPRLCNRIERQIKRLIDGVSPSVAERLQREVLFMVARSASNTSKIGDIKAALALEDAIPATFELQSEDAQLLPRLRAMREAVLAAKGSWTKFTGGHVQSAGAFMENLVQLRERAHELGRPELISVVDELHAVGETIRGASAVPPESTALEVATALLLVDDACDRYSALPPQFAKQAEAMVARLRALRGMAVPSTHDASLLDDMTRRAQERVAISQLVAEIRTNLREIESGLDTYFRDPSHPEELAKLDKPINQVVGALRVLNEPKAEAALSECVERIRSFRTAGAQPDQAEFERIAGVLSGLGFYVDALAHGKADFDTAMQPIRPKAPVEEAHIPTAPSVEAQLEQQQRETHNLVQAWQANPEDVTRKEELRQHVEAMQHDAALVADADLERKAQETLSLLAQSDTAAVQPELAKALQSLQPEAAPEIAPSAEVQKLAEASNEVIDAELLEVYIEEAGEVVGTIREQLDVLRGQPANVEALRTIRRGYHTLKGSGRMVGLMRLGEAAWAVEKLLNGWLEAERAGNEALFALIEDGRQLFERAVQALKAGTALPDETVLIAKANALESGESVVMIGDRRLTPALYEIFLGESRSHVASLQKMHARISDAGLVNDDDVRAAHTLAGVCGSVGFTAIRDVAGALEGALGRLVGMPLAAASHEALGEGIVAVEAMVQAVARKEEPTANPDVVELLHAIRIAETEEAEADLTGSSASDQALSFDQGLSFGGDELEANDLPLSQPFSAADGQATPLFASPGPRDGSGGAVGEAGSTAPGAFVDDVALADFEARLAADEVQAPVAPVAPRLDPVEFLVSHSLAPSALTEPSRVQEPALRQSLQDVDALEPQRDIDAPSAFAADVSASAPAEEALLDEPGSGLAAQAFALTQPEPRSPAQPADEAPAPAQESAHGEDIDPQLLELFLEESQELVPAVATSLREWRHTPSNTAAGNALQRYLHTLKGSARMAGAMNLGEILHDMETRVENAIALSPLPLTLFDDLEAQFDRVNTLFERLNAPEGEPAAIAAPLAPAAALSGAQPEGDELTGEADSAIAEELLEAEPSMGLDRVDAAAAGAARAAAEAKVPDAERAAVLRVRADTVDRLVNQAGEVAIARSRIEGEVKALKSSLGDLTENINRLRTQLREIEIQAETAIQSRMVQTGEDRREFDPLEFDRFTRFQELTRMLAESVSDVASVHQNIARSLDETDAALLAQSRMSRDLQQDLLRVRMVPFKNISERLYRVVRQAAKESAKRATLDIRGSQTELDRSVLERITAPFEHMIRNCVAHGIELPMVRRSAGKAEVGEIRVEVRHEGNEVMLAVSDDGAGLDYDRIRAKAIERGLIEADAALGEAELGEMIFMPGFSTAAEVTQLAGRGVGMDVVKNEINALGGRVEVSSERGKGARFTVYLPLTLAVTQAVIVAAGSAKYAIPGLLVEQVRQLRVDELAECYRTREASWQNRRTAFHYLPRLLGDLQSVPENKRLSPVIFVRSGTNLVAVHVDDMIGNQEIVVKNTGPLLARVPGVTGATVLGTGEIVLIINPVVVAIREQAAAMPQAPAAPVAVPAVPESARTVMIVDDSLTVRKITGRLLTREGYSVLTARDGVDAIEQLEEALPDVMVVDIEMPRMDGFDLTRNVRSNPRLRHLPIVMVTSRTADKHRNYAMEIGVNAFLGKPYRDDELLAAISGLVAGETHIARVASSSVH